MHEKYSEIINQKINSLPVAAAGWITRHRTKLIIALTLIQVLFLAGIAGSYYAVGWYGKEIRLQTKPLDPTDLLYGDYVILNYEISRINKFLWKGSGELPLTGETVYVVLKPKAGATNATYEAIAVYNRKPAKMADEIVVKGRLDYSFDDQLQVRYGLEKYYVPENTGKALEEKAGNLVALIKVAAWGRPVITGLEVPTP